jgi:hypothetical protein
MNTAKVKASITKIVDAYMYQLSTFDETIFQQTPPINGWSYSEVYSHIFDASLLSLIATESCIKKEGENKPTDFRVKLILFFGMFPPAQKFKVPTKLLSRIKKINKADALAYITQFRQQLEILYPLLKNTDSNIKVKHPRLGYLNAKQWLRFIEIHLNHHLKQLTRITKSYNTI